MASRCAFGAALVAVAAARAHRPAPPARASSDALHPPPPGAPPPGARARGAAPGPDLAHARAIMEKYQRMSREALEANALGGGGAPGVANGDDGVAREGAIAGEGPVAGAADLDVLTGTEALPAPAPVVAPPKKKKRAKRIPAERLFGDMDLSGGDFCVPYVVVGGGTAAWSAIQAIRKRDARSAILLVTEEEAYPYNRTPLSKELWAPSSAGLFTSETGTRGAVEYTYAAVEGADEGAPVSIVRGRKVVGLNVDAKTVSLSGGPVIQYDKLLLATGGAPREAATVCGALAAPELAENVSVFRKLGDFRSLREGLGADGSRVAVVGGGFLGTELAVAMACEGRRVTLLCAEPGVLYKVLPRYLSRFLSRRLADVGVTVVESAVVTDAKAVEGGRVQLEIGAGLDGNVVGPVDKVVVATGILPRVELAAGAGLEIDSKNGGIVVNDQMNAEADVWVAGDVASFWDRALGRRRIEHWGDRMAGGDARYGLQSVFWSDLSNLGVSFEAVGRVEHGLETVACWNLSAPAFEHAPSSSSYTEGVVYYLRNKVVVGAVLWNLHGRKPLAEARKAISSKLKIAGDVDATRIIALPDAAHSAVVRTQAEVELELLD